MNTCTNLRRIRLKHDITLEALSEAAGVSNQYISQVELLQIPPTRTSEKQCEAAMEHIISQYFESARALDRDYHAVKGALLEESEEEPDGL